jgi:SAM-dependent methyltransferase
MGELFRQIQPETSLAWTGERLVTSQDDAIEAEHYHRYFLARELCRGKAVLDVASGEGYGSAFLAQTANSVVGVEIDPASVEHASQEYRAANLRFAVGDAARLPLEDHSVDVVVSFETIEHLSDQAAFFAEVKRVLRPSGFFIASTPDMEVYSALGTESNPYHVREMTSTEFRGILGRAFRHVSIIRQRSITGSVILADEMGAKAGNPWVFEQRDARAYEADRRLLRAPFLLAIASDGAMPLLSFSLYIQSANIGNDVAEVKAELQRLRDLEERVREQEPAINDMKAAVASARVEVDGYKRVNDALERNLDAVKQELESEHERASSLQSRLDLSTSLARQQSLTVQRNLLELQSARQEIQGYRQQIEDRTQQLEDGNSALEQHKRELDICRQNLENRDRDLEEHKRALETYKTANAQLAGLLIPPRIRSAVPSSLKSPLRAVKRSLRSLLRGSS